MSKHTKVNRKSKLEIHRLITVKEFLKRVKSDPDSIFEDFDVKYAIEKLQEWYLSDNGEQKENAERILKKAGLGAYIPKSPRGNLKKYKNNPQRLFQEVDAWRRELKSELEKSKFPKRGKQQQKLAGWIKEKYKIKLKGKFLDDLRLMAIGIIAKQNYVTGWTLFKLYYDLKRRRGNKNVFVDLDTYHQAYCNYVLKEHIAYALSEVGKRVKEAFLPFQNVTMEIGEKVEENFKSLQPAITKVHKQLKQAFSNIPVLKVSNLRTG